MSTEQKQNRWMSIPTLILAAIAMLLGSGLTYLQRVVIEALEPGTPPTSARPDLPPGSGECAVHAFSDYAQEADAIAGFIDQWIHRDGLRPRDICLLAREKPGSYAHLLMETLQKRGFEHAMRSNCKTC